ncbi:MAG: NUDIX hydrolase [bacterium]|nr:NUDIX hydrolase [bacterium]
MKTDLTSNSFIFDKDKVLLVYHKKYSMWIGVGGHIEADETPDEAAIREIKEEVGIDVNILNGNINFGVFDNTVKNCYLPFHADVHNVGDHHHYAQYYACTIKNGTPKLLDEFHKELFWFTEDEVEKDERIQPKTKQIVKKAFEVYKKTKSE